MSNGDSDQDNRHLVAAEKINARYRAALTPDQLAELEAVEKAQRTRER